MNELVLHNYFRSSASFRVRAALNLKGIDYEYVAHHLRKGEQRSERYLDLNPQGLVPALEIADGVVLSQSIAIIEYLDEVYPVPPLLPADPLARARVRSLAMMVACDIHPLNNLRTLKHLADRFGADDEAIAEWFRTWVVAAFAPLETRLSTEPDTGRFCHGDTVGLADVCLVGQTINNARFTVDMSAYPTIQRIHDACMALAAVKAAAPPEQPDAE
jgi:maleylpyruvate isomerase